MIHCMSVPNSMWSWAVSVVVHLRNRTFSRAGRLPGDVPITLLTSKALEGSKFRVIGCAVFTIVLDKLRRKLGEKAFRGVMLGYLPDAAWYRVYNHVNAPHHHIGTCCFSRGRSML
jgi:hypothetical protein